MRPAAVTMLTLVAMTIAAAETVTTNDAPTHFLMLDSFGRLVKLATDEVHQSLLPAGEDGLTRQIPTLTKGASVPPSVLRRQDEARQGQGEFEWFPSVSPPLMPYLASQDEFGNTAIKYGALITLVPLEPQLQGAKYWLSDYGLRYSLQQTFNYVGMSDVMQGSSTLGFYTFDFQGKWAVFDSPGAGTAGWVSAHIEAKSGLGTAGGSQSAQSNLGTVTDPTGILSSHDGWRIPELAWQQSFDNGKWVVVAGMVNQGDYFDGNAYANSGRGQFMNSALIDTMVVPLTAYNLGVNIQWQPDDEWYAMIGSSVGNGHAGVTPWTDFSWNNWSLVGEVGYTREDFFGLGPGIYRIQPFVGQPEGDPVAAGIGFNFQQQLGRHSPFGWFGRFGTGGSERFREGEQRLGTGSQIGTGFVMNAPLAYLGLVPRLRRDLLGVGFVWSHLTSSPATIYHEDEYVAETFYTLQLTPTIRLQPDLQIVWDPAYNPDGRASLVFQLQLDIAW